MPPFLAVPTAAAETSDGTSGVAVVLAVAGALIAALVLAEVIAAVVRAVGRRSWLSENLSRRARLPLRAVLVVTAVWVALRLTTSPDDGSWRTALDHLLLIALIISVAWLVGALAFVVEDAAVARYRTDVPDNRHARRIRTQVMVLRRLTVAVLVICAVGGVLLTFDGARAAGAGVLASAGLVSLVVGLAAQGTLGNVFAGLQLAFTDAIRVDDVVVVADEWGRVEEITMTYVVVHLWDDRRLILPSTWFTTTPFENWTRRAADLLGTVELDLDWAVPVEEMRTELTRLLQSSELWDHRVGVLQVTEATGGVVRVRALASAADAPTLFDLRCFVREGLVAWLQAQHPEALPRTRWQDAGALPPAAARPAPSSAPTASDGDGNDTDATGTLTGRRAVKAARSSGLSGSADSGGGGHVTRDQTIQLDSGRDSRLFTGSLSAVARSKAFAGPGEEVIAEREQTAQGPIARPEP
jgi:small-conductance mechanosensitive channel